MEKKYSFSDSSQEDRDWFIKEISKIADQRSLHVSVIPQYEQISETLGFQTKAIMLIRKMVEVITPEVNPQE